jgi:hypothetical protein
MYVGVIISMKPSMYSSVAITVRTAPTIPQTDNHRGTTAVFSMAQDRIRPPRIHGSGIPM